MRIIRKVLFYTIFTSSIAIGGANLGTYFDYKFHNYDYGKMKNRTTLLLKGKVDKNETIKLALEAAKIKIIGSKAPEEATLKVKLEERGGDTFLETNYRMIWNTNKGIKKRDVEDVIIRWKLVKTLKKFVAFEAQTRFHFKKVNLELSNQNPVIVITNPAHTPMIPGANVRYEGDPNTTDIFTVFSVEKWAGSSLSCSLPNEFKSLIVTFLTEVIKQRFPKGLKGCEDNPLLINMGKPTQVSKKESTSSVYIAQELVCRSFDFTLSHMQQVRDNPTKFEQFKSKVGDMLFAEIVLLTGSKEKANKFLADIHKLNEKYDGGILGDPKKRATAWKYWRKVDASAKKYALKDKSTDSFLSTLARIVVPNVDSEGSANLVGLNWKKLGDVLPKKGIIPKKLKKYFGD
jgi:hypothetical protein